MSGQKLRVKNTQLDNLISNLRGEVGEIITSWVLLRHMMASERQLSSDDFAKDLANENLAFVSMLKTKLADEIVARLSELAEVKIGQLLCTAAGSTLRIFDGYGLRDKLPARPTLTPWSRRDKESSRPSSTPPPYPFLLLPSIYVWTRQSGRLFVRRRTSSSILTGGGTAGSGLTGCSTTRSQSKLRGSGPIRLQRCGNGRPEPCE